MNTATFIAKNALRNKRRAALTILSVAVSLFLFVTLLVALRELTMPPEDIGASLRIAVRNRISLTNALPERHSSVIVCQMTSELAEADFRVMIEPGPESGLRERSQIMADKPVTVRRERIARQIGRLGPAELARLNIALALVMGLAD